MKKWDPSGCFQLSIPDSADRIRRKTYRVIIEVNSEMSASDRFFIIIIIFFSILCSQNLQSIFVSKMAVEKLREKKANPWNCIFFFFAQENDIPPFNSGVKRILKGICEQSHILGDHRRQSTF